MSIADKLLQVNQVKQDIKVAIETKGIPMNNVSFTEYANKILEISGGGEWELLTHVVNVEDNPYTVDLSQFYNSGWRIFAITVTTELEIGGTFILDTTMNANFIEAKSLWENADIEDIQHIVMSYYHVNKEAIFNPRWLPGEFFDITEIIVWGVSK